MVMSMMMIYDQYDSLQFHTASTTKWYNADVTITGHHMKRWGDTNRNGTPQAEPPKQSDQSSVVSLSFSQSPNDEQIKKRERAKTRDI